MRTPEVSVIMATYNRAHLLPRAVESILSQTFDNLEIIIVDNNSTDDTPELLDSLKKSDDRVRPFRVCQNLGPARARNYAVGLAKGKYIAIMDDDDIAVPDRLFLQREVLNQEEDIGLTFSSVKWIDSNGHEIGKFPGVVVRGEFPFEPEKVFELLYLESNKVPNVTIMIRREIMKKMQYPEVTWVGEDWLWCMQLAASGIKFRASAEPLVYVSRESNRQGLMIDRKKVIKDQRVVISEIRRWLKIKRIDRFEHLHSVALANQFVREARMWSGMKGMFYCAKALAVDPGNRFATTTLLEIIARGRNRLKRFFVRG